MAKNHYVSQLIIKRFSKAVTTFDMQTRRIIEKRQAAKIFYEHDIYDTEIEKKLAHDLEQPFAQLLDEKIINTDSVIKLTRRDLFLLKKFLLLDSVRTYEPEAFEKVINNFSGNAERYLMIPIDPFSFKAKKLPLTSDLHISAYELQMRAMQIYLDCETENELIKHPLITRELYCWAKVFIASYLTFWDSADNQEFILSSTGMISEYEPSHLLFEGLDLSKFSYLLRQIQNKKDNENVMMHYCMLMNLNQIMYENFEIFNLSSNRCMVLVHPFFRLYNDAPLLINKEKINEKKPDIWPSCFETKDIVLVPGNQYTLSPYLMTMNDIFEYRPIKLSEFDTIYVNSLILNATHKMIGFNDIEKIIDSLSCANLMNAVDDRKLLYEMEGLDALSRFIDNLLKDKYTDIFNYFKKKESMCKIDPFEYLDSYGDKCWRDIIENKYLLEYLLSDEEKVRTMKNFAFMGSPDERVEGFKSFLKKLGN